MDRTVSDRAILALVVLVFGLVLLVVVAAGGPISP
jgi:hypothetical protein